MEEFLDALFGFIFHPTAIGFVLGGIASFIIVVVPMWYYNRRGRGG